MEYNILIMQKFKKANSFIHYDLNLLKLKTLSQFESKIVYYFYTKTTHLRYDMVIIFII